MSSEESIFNTELTWIGGYEFKAKFDMPSLSEVTMDEPKPLGRDAGPNASRLLSAAVGNCLSASLLFCLSKARVEPQGLKTSVETVIKRNMVGRWRIASMSVKLYLTLREGDAARSKRCLDLFEDYCTVTQSVREGINVDVDVRMNKSGSVS
ncbi:MAG: OsmC family protein [Candidatus Bathyarchaeia archaeon]